jgi:hypothetical protein
VVVVSEFRMDSVSLADLVSLIRLMRHVCGRAWSVHACLRGMWARSLDEFGRFGIKGDRSGERSVCDNRRREAALERFRRLFLELRDLREILVWMLVRCILRTHRILVWMLV